MNRKGKKSPLVKAKTGKKASRKKPSLQKRSLFSSKQKGSSGAKKTKNNLAIGQNPQIKRNLAVKKSNTTPASNSQVRSNHQPKKPKSPLWLAIYAVIVIVGLSTIFGTAVSLATSFSLSEAQQNEVTAKAVSADPNPQVELDKLFEIASLGNELSTLKQQLQELAQQYPKLEPEIFLVDLDTKGFVSIQGKEPIASASTIKLPVLVAFFQDVDRGKIALEEQLSITQDVIAEGSGDMQYQTPGTKFSALETASKMMTISDNTATNMLIKRMGGIEALNQRFSQMGLTETRLRNPLPDLTGTNTTSPEDLGNLLVKIESGELMTLRSRDRLIHIMRNIVRNTLLPQGLESGAIIAHKTGDIKSVLADVGMIDMPNGKRYIASVLVKRPDNSPEAKEFIQETSRLAYQYFNNMQKSSFTLREDN